MSATQPLTTRRLAELGLTPGAEVTVVQRNASAMVISTRDSRVAIGTPLADWVLVADENAEAPA